MKAILNIALCSVAAIGGVFAATTLKSPSGPDSAAHAKDAGHGKAESHAKAKPTKKGHDSYEASDSDDFEFLKFKRQFVVPVIGEDRVDALVILNVGISLSGDVKDDIFNLEPKFRDAFMRELLGMSNAGYFNAEMTNPQTYEVLRETLLRAARDVTEYGVKDILILDFARQDR